MVTAVPPGPMVPYLDRVINAKGNYAPRWVDAETHELHGTVAHSPHIKFLTSEATTY
jgi:hypothetical protein